MAAWLESCIRVRLLTLRSSILSPKQFLVDALRLKGHQHFALQIAGSPLGVCKILLESHRAEIGEWNSRRDACSSPLAGLDKVQR